MISFLRLQQMPGVGGARVVTPQERNDQANACIAEFRRVAGPDLIRRVTGDHYQEYQQALGIAPGNSLGANALRSHASALNAFASTLRTVEQSLGAYATTHAPIESSSNLNYMRASLSEFFAAVRNWVDVFGSFGSQINQIVENMSQGSYCTHNPQSPCCINGRFLLREISAASNRPLPHIAPSVLPPVDASVADASVVDASVDVPSTADATARDVPVYTDAGVDTGVDASRAEAGVADAGVDASRAADVMDGGVGTRVTADASVLRIDVPEIDIGTFNWDETFGRVRQASPLMRDAGARPTSLIDPASLQGNWTRPGATNTVVPNNGATSVVDFAAPGGVRVTTQRTSPPSGEMGTGTVVSSGPRSALIGSAPAADPSSSSAIPSYWTPVNLSVTPTIQSVNRNSQPAVGQYLAERIRSSLRVDSSVNSESRFVIRFRITYTASNQAQISAVEYNRQQNARFDSAARRAVSGLMAPQYTERVRFPVSWMVEVPVTD